MVLFDVGQEAVFKYAHLVHGHVVEKPADPGKDRQHLIGDRHGFVLVLFEQFDHARATCQLRLRRFIQFTAKLRKGGHLPILGQIQPKGPGDLFHGFDLRRPADAGHRQAHVNGRTNARIKQVAGQINLPVGNGNHVGGNVRRHVAGLGFNDGQCRQTPGALLIAQLGGAFQQPGMQEKHVAGKRLTTRGATEQQRKLPVGHGMFGQIIVDNEGVFAIVTKILTHGDPGVGGHKLQGGRVAGRGRHDGGVGHRIMIFERLHHTRHGGTLLTNGDVDAKHVKPFLVDDGVDGDGRLSRLAIPDDQLPLPATNGNHGVNRLQARLQRLMHGLALHHPGGTDFDQPNIRGCDRAFPVEGLPHRIHHPPDERRAHGHFGNPSRAGDPVAFLNPGVGAHQHDAYAVLFKIQRHPDRAPGKLQQLPGHGTFEAVDFGDAVSHLHDRTGFGHINTLIKVFDLVLNDRTDFFRLDPHALPLYQLSPYPVELTSDRAVIDSTPDMYLQARQQGGIGLKVDVHLAVQCRAQPAQHVPLHVLIHRLCRHDGDVPLATVLRQQCPEGLGNVRQGGHAIVFQQLFAESSQHRRATRPFAQGGEHVELFFPRHRR